MSLKIDRSEKGLYTITNIDTNKIIENNITLAEAKKFFINKRLWEFISDIIRIDGDFPNGFFVNGRMVAGPLNGGQYVNYASQQENVDELLFNKFLEIQKNLQLDFNIIGVSYDE